MRTSIKQISFITTSTLFDTFYEDYLEYKWYDNNTLNILIPKDDILHRIEKKNTMEHSKKIKSLEDQIEDLKKENQVLEEILTSKLDINNKNNITNNNMDNTWKTVKANLGNKVNNKDINGRFNFIDSRNKYQPTFIHENELTEPHINNRVNNDFNKYKNAFNNNIHNNVTIRKKSPTPVINQFAERDTLGVSKQSKNLIPE